MKDRSIFRAGFLASTMLASTSLAAMAGEVTTSRLSNPDKEPQNWLMVNKDYAAHRYSELDQVNKNNVKDLHVAFTVALGGVEGVGKVPLGGSGTGRFHTRIFYCGTAEAVKSARTDTSIECRKLKEPD